MAKPNTMKAITKRFNKTRQKLDMGVDSVVVVKFKNKKLKRRCLIRDLNDAIESKYRFTKDCTIKSKKSAKSRKHAQSRVVAEYVPIIPYRYIGSTHKQKTAIGIDKKDKK
ncbi:hypothetical protein FACS1894120_3990 [Clostridia bacterium]|nr:hypothetical protein FACS1894120_3990 [Clostridia bacterium]